LDALRAHAFFGHKRSVKGAYSLNAQIAAPLLWAIHIGVQKIALTAIVDQADNFNLEVPLQGQVVVRPTQSCEIDEHCLPVSALMYACVFELIASKMQSVISIMS
jgi:hypothetical protein